MRPIVTTTTVAEAVARSTAASGVPLLLEDVSTLRTVAEAMLPRADPPRRQEQAA